MKTTQANRIASVGDISSPNRLSAARIATTPSITTVTATMPQKSPVSPAAAAISAGRKVPKVGTPITFRNSTTTSAPSGSISTVCSSVKGSPSRSNSAQTLKAGKVVSVRSAGTCRRTISNP